MSKESGEPKYEEALKSVKKEDLSKEELEKRLEVFAEDDKDFQEELGLTRAVPTSTLEEILKGRLDRKKYNTDLLSDDRLMKMNDYKIRLFEAELDRRREAKKRGEHWENWDK